VARPKDFVTDEVLDRAGELFWRSGYQATSIPELEIATGLGRGSIYNAFGDKEGLYLAALDRYQRKFGAPPAAQLDHDNVGEGIRRMFDAIIDRMGCEDVPDGCLMINATVECDGSSNRIETVVAESIVNTEARLKAEIDRAVRSKQIPIDTDSERLARFFAAIALSLGVAHKASKDLGRLHDIVDVAMQSWPATVPGKETRSRSR
jgi:TetR/AcrR family transcriptional regulator, transcriptional repressor for nem operon